MVGVGSVSRGRLAAASLLLSVTLLAAAFEAQARCMSLSMDRRGVEFELARVEHAFVGRLLRVWRQPPPERPRDCYGEYCLDRIEVTSGPRPSVWLGEFQVRRHYVGEPARRLTVRVRDGLNPRKRYLVYAYMREGELVADGGCEGRAFPIGAKTREHLAYLDSLPAPGSGGIVDLGFFAANGSPLPGRALTFEGVEGVFSLVTGNERTMRSKAWPAGRYRLASPPPDGYRYVCGSRDCDGLMVQDRIVKAWRIRLEALTSVRIGLRDGAGAVVNVEAEFEWLDAMLGTPVDFVRAPVIGRDERITIAGRLPPGPVVPTLIISEIVEVENGQRVALRKRWYSGGVAFEQAQVHELPAGDHEIEFTLPAELKPVAVDVRHHGLQAAHGWQWVERSLRGWVEPGRIPSGRTYTHTCRELQAGPCQQVFTALPGQTWSLSSLQHRIRANGAREWTVRASAFEREEVQVDVHWQFAD